MPAALKIVRGGGGAGGTIMSLADAAGVAIPIPTIVGAATAGLSPARETTLLLAGITGAHDSSMSCAQLAGLVAGLTNTPLKEKALQVVFATLEKARAHARRRRLSHWPAKASQWTAT